MRICTYFLASFISVVLPVKSFAATCPQFIDIVKLGNTTAIARDIPKEWTIYSSGHLGQRSRMLRFAYAQAFATSDVNFHEATRDDTVITRIHCYYELDGTFTPRPYLYKSTATTVGVLRRQGWQREAADTLQCQGSNAGACPFP